MIKTQRLKQLIAIQKDNRGFTKRWIAYCEAQSIPYKLVDVYALGVQDGGSYHGGADPGDFWQQFDGCNAFMWHISHEDHRDVLSGMAMMQILEQNGIITFPTTNQLWHFDDKLAQVLFFRKNEVPAPKTEVFYTREAAASHLKNTPYPLIGKLKRGSAASNVFLIKNEADGLKFVRKSFGRGYPLYNLRSRYGDLWRRTSSPREKVTLGLKFVVRMFRKPDYSRYLGRESGYVMFQEFIPNDGSDLRVVVVGDRLVSVKRSVRKNDFRASGSGLLEYPNERLERRIRDLAFGLMEKLDVPSMGFDLIQGHDGEIYVIEMSYGFPSENFLDGASGYWTRDGEFVPSEIRLQEWMVNWVLDRTNS